MKQTKTILAWGSSSSIAVNLSKKIDCPLIQPELRIFPDRETGVFIPTKPETQEVIILATYEQNINSKLIEILLVVDSLKRLGEYTITLLSPWFPYSPQDKVFRIGESLSSKLIIKLFEHCGIEKFIVADIHSPKVKEMFKKELIDINPTNLFFEFIKQNLQNYLQNSVVAILDEGDTSRATNFANLLNVPTVKFKKTRDLITGEVTFHDLIGDVNQKNVFICDDYVSTGGTLIKSAEYLKSKGALEYFCFVTHIVSKDVIQKIEHAAIDRLITTNTFNYQITLPEKFIQLDITKLFADYI